MTVNLAFVRVFDNNPADPAYSGTAFFITPQHLLTAKHVLHTCKNGVILKLPQSQQKLEQSDFKVENYDQIDLASIYLNTPVTNAYCLPLAIAPLQTMQEVVLHGFPDAEFELNHRKTHVSSYMNPRYGWVLADGVRKGMSGGAVTRDSQLVGVIYARDEDSKVVTYCISIDAIRTCLGETPVDALPNHNATGLERAASVFVGREAELAQLKAALLDNTQAPVAITAVQGMAGVGKSWLADHFYVTHETEFKGGYQRFSLNVDALPSADLLLSDLAERLQIAAPKAQLPHQVAHRLKQPRTLVHIENVDSDAAASLVANFCKHLPHCPIVLSGRLEGLGRTQRWQLIPLKPLNHQDALTQLRLEMEWQQVSAIAEVDALQLVTALGSLPLAVHLAAGYLAAGYSVAEFLRELQATQFALTPEDVTDDLFTRDPARAVLQSTFQISLRLLNQQAQAKKIAATEQTFASLGYTPSAGFGLSIASAVLDLDESESKRLLRLAYKLSLLDQSQTERWQLHPLLAQYLRQQASDSEASERLNQWFLLRLPEPKSAVAKAWHELNQEQAALSEWLAQLPLERCIEVERAGSQYAMRNGSFAYWVSMLQKALQSGELSDEQRSNVLFTLAYVAQSSGHVDLALNSAQAKQKLDEARGAIREATLAKGKIADILQARGQLDDALRIRYEDQLPVYEQLGEVREIAITKGKIALIYFRQGKQDEAIKLQESILPIYEALADKRTLLIDQTMLAQMYLVTGQHFERAKQLLVTALKAAQEMQIPEAAQIQAILNQNNKPSRFKRFWSKLNKILRR